MRKLSIPHKDETLIIPVEQIIRCEADRSYTWIHLKNGDKIISSKNLGKFEKVLSASNDYSRFFFFRISHGEIINTNFIKKFFAKNSEIELTNGTKLSISQRKKSSFKKAISILYQTM